MASGNDHSSSSSSSNSSTISQAIEMPNANTNHETVRPLANFPTDIWGDRFLTLPFTNSELELCSKQVEALKGTVKDLLMSSVNDPIENILVINSLFRLGVSYHFESEIEEQLSRLFTTLPQHITHNDCDLYTTSIIFLVFRSHGYRITSGVFMKFKNSEGKFKEEMCGDIKGMISLYEASHWRLNGELILEEALSFTKSRLELIANQLSSTLADYIVHALQWPQQRSVPRFDARHYISYYEKHETRNEKHVFLKFAKLDFNRVQMLLQQELSLLSRWWKESNVKSRFPYARHRMVEFFFMGIGVYFEPHFARARHLFTKIVTVLTFVDDIYDAYGIYEELKYLTKAIHRFDHGAMDELPAEYLKTLYETVLNICKEMEEEVSKEGRAYSVSYTVEELKKLVVTYDFQARWTTHERLELPTFDEYFANGINSVGAVINMCFLFIGMEEADENAFKWLTNPHCPLVEAMGKIGRLVNDIQTNEGEEKRGGQLSGMACYMKQYGCSREEAIEAFKGMVEVAWRDLNEAFMRPWHFPAQIIVRYPNLIRVADIWYKTDDGFSNPELSLKHHIIKLLLDPIPIHV